MTNQPTLSLAEAQAIVATKTAPRITVDSITAKIRNVEYIKHNITTICLIEMVDGFIGIGHSTPASPANYDYGIGQRYAYENAFKQLWQLEGYMLRHLLYIAGVS